MANDTTKQWYYARADQKFGPVTMQRLREMAGTEELHPSDLLWSEGMSEWRPAGQSKSLFPQNTLHTQTRYAGFWLRVAAAYLDETILGLVNWCIYVLILLRFSPAFIGVEIPKNMNLTREDLSILLVSGAWILSILPMVVLRWIYFAGMESSSKRATIGKRAVGIIVTDIKGDRVSFWRASGRFWGKIVSGLILCFGFLMIPFTNRKQALHDLMSDCLVMRSR